MTFTFNRTSLYWGGAALFVLLLSVVLFLSFADKKRDVVLFFPNDTNHRLTGESRVVPKQGTLEGNITALVDAVILGPATLSRDRDVPRSTKVRSLMYRGGTVYLDFSPDILFPEQETSLGFSESVDAIRKTIRFNYPQVKKIVVTVNGEEPKAEIRANSANN